MLSDPNEYAGRGLIHDGYLVCSVGRPLATAINFAFEAGHKFFALAIEEKLACRMELDCGYRPTGIEFSRSAATFDTIESFTVSARTEHTGIRLRSNIAYDLHAKMLAVFKHLEVMAEAIIEQYANFLSPSHPPRSFAGKLTQWSCLQLNCALPKAAGIEFINEQHEDGHLLTISCATGPGLEIFLGGRFIPATIEIGRVIIMPGGIASLLSGGNIRPMEHRVRHIPSPKQRLAIMFFADISPDECAPWISNEINEGLDIGSYVLTNSSRFGLCNFPRTPHTGS